MPKTYRVTPIVMVVNLLPETLARLEIGPKSRYLLTVQGRKTGRSYTTPVTLVDHNDRRFLVAPYGEVNWVRNARVSRQVTLKRGRKVRQVGISDVPLSERAPILQKYLRLEPVTQPYFEARADSPSGAFALEADQHPVFLIEEPPTGPVVAQQLDRAPSASLRPLQGAKGGGSSTDLASRELISARY